jgi:hypothetical protein
MMNLIVLLSLFCISVDGATAIQSAKSQQKSKIKKAHVALPVMFDSVEVYVALGADSSSARAEAKRVEEILAGLRANAVTSEKIILRERNSAGIIMIDTLEALIVRHENRVYPELSPLANAMAIRDQILSASASPPADSPWDEEELLLRLLLGVVYPFSLLVVLRMTRTGIVHWERNWRSAALQWLTNLAERRGLSEKDIRGKKIINLLTGIERLVLYGAATILISFGWFALFPQTQPLAVSLLNRIIGPLIDLIGGTARGVLLLGYSVAVILLTYWITRQISQRRRLSIAPNILADPVIYFPLRIGIWIVALFLILFPYPGAPRLFAMGVLLITLLATLIALRPIIEEIAAHLHQQHLRA